MKRLPLSLNIAPASKAALLARAAREGHRYPAVLAATLLERALQGEDEGGAGADPNVVANVAVKLTECAQKLRARGAVPADRVESLASALDELAGRLGGLGAVMLYHEPPRDPYALAYTGLWCAVCGEPQFNTPSGVTCANRHGGADGVEPAGDTR